MSTEQNKATARRWFLDILNQAKMGVADEIFAASHVIRDPHAPPSGWPSGPEGLKMVAPPMRAAFPDLKVTVEDQIAEDDRVATRWTVVGTHGGPLRGTPASGRAIKVSGVNVVRFVESWFNFDMLSLLRQIGAVAMPQPPSR